MYLGVADVYQSLSLNEHKRVSDFFVVGLPIIGTENLCSFYTRHAFPQGQREGRTGPIIAG